METLLQTKPLTEKTRTARPSFGQSFESPMVASGTSVIVGRLVAFDVSGHPLVEFAGNELETPIPARSVLELSKKQIGTDVVLILERGNASKPIILGCIREPVLKSDENPVNVKVDGEQLIFTAEKEIVLNCGKASITLTRAGKVLINGEYLLSRSSGANRIKGGSVQIN